MLAGAFLSWIYSTLLLGVGNIPTRERGDDDSTQSAAKYLSREDAMKILVLDDEQEIVDCVKLMLCDEHTVEGATDAQTAVNMIADGHYDFVIVDYKMPEHDGIWFMKHAHLPKGTKALLLTAFLNNDVVSQMFKSGISGYLVKPVTAEDLLYQLDFHSKSHSSI
jgi:DNA-binding response OmpR family regulator